MKQPKRFRTEEEWLAHETGEMRACRWAYALSAVSVLAVLAVVVWRIVS